MTESNLAFIIAAYSVSWVVILAYLARLARKSVHARADYDRVAQHHRGDSGT